MRNKRARYAGGFSLFEVLIVLVVAAILATFGFAYLIGSRPAALLHRAELQLSSDLGLSRDRAYNEEVPVRVVFDLANETYSTELQNPATGDWEEVVAPKTLPEDINLTDVSFPSDTVYFTPRGTLVVGGSITITNSKSENAVLTGVIPTGRFPILGGALR